MTVPTSSNGSRARHGRVPARETASDALVRRRLVRLAVLPAGVVAVTAAAVVAYAMRAQGSGGTGAPGSGVDDATVWGVLVGALLLTCAVVVGAALFASSEARATVERYTALRRSAEQSQAEIRSLLRQLEQGERPRALVHPPLPEPSGDALDLLAHELGVAQRTAESAVTEAAALVRAGTSGSEEKVEVFVNLARRLQSLVHREIELLDELENEVEDPDLLKGLFHVDHLATRIRRHAENLAVLGGAVSRRQWTRPVTMTEVLRSSIAEVEQYSRVKLVPPIEGTLRGHAVADVIHLLAELVENATLFSAPQTQVLMRAQHVTAGLAVEVEDRGLGMTATEQNRMNALLSDPEQFDVGELLSDGRIGLFVVSALARRHGIVVQLQSNIYGGIQAVLVLPRGLLGDEAQSAAARPGATNQQAAPARQPEPAVTAQARAERAEVSHGMERQRAIAQRPQPSQPQPQAQQHQAQHQVPQPRAQDRAYPEPRPHHQLDRSFQPPAGATAPVPAQQRPETRATATVPEPPYAAPLAPADGTGERPELPKRRRQEHLVPELRDTPTAPTSSDDPEAGHDPGLMAAFRRGTSLAGDADGAEESAPASGGETPRPAS